MTRPFSTSIDDRDYDCIMSIAYEGDDEWYIEIESPGRLPEAHREAIIEEFRATTDWSQMYVDYFNDLEESMACDRYHSERDDR